MNRISYKTILAVIALTVFGVSYGAAQTGQPRRAEKKVSTQAGKKAQGTTNPAIPDMSESAMTNEPHQVLAIAYRENVAIFARALRDQALAGSLSSDFARAATGEIGRSLDQADEHHREHLKTMMNADARSKFESAPREMDMRAAGLKDLFRILEKDVGEYTLNSKQIAIDSDAILKRLGDIPKAPRQE
jgi:hypothetical protein